MCNCNCRRGSSGWLAFWLLVVLLVIAYAQGKSDQNKIVLQAQIDLPKEIDVQIPEPMSVTRTPSVNEELAMDRLLRDMEEEGRRLPKI